MRRTWAAKVGQRHSRRGEASLVEWSTYLFEVVTNPKTGESYTNAEVARMSAGEITEEEVEVIRTRRIADP